MYFNNQSEKIEKNLLYLYSSQSSAQHNNILEELLKIAYFISSPAKQGSYDKKI